MGNNSLDRAGVSPHITGPSPCRYQVNGIILFHGDKADREPQVPLQTLKYTCFPSSCTPRSVDNCIVKFFQVVVMGVGWEYWPRSLA